MARPRTATSPWTCTSLVGPAALKRQRAYTLFMNAYSEVQRAIGYLDPKNVDDVAPSVHVPRGPAKKQAETETPEQPAAAPAPPQPVAPPPAVTPATTTDGDDSPYNA